MNFLKKIFGIGSKKDTIENNPVVNILSVVCDNNIDPLVEIQISDISQEASDNLANMLFNLNNGFYMSSILKVLISMSNNDSNIHEFISDTIKKWQTLVGNHNHSYSDDPVVNPTDFHKQLSAYHE